MSADVSSVDATAQAELVRKGELTPGDLVEAAINRIERLNPKLNAVITPTFEKARAQARSGNLPDGPFRGVPFLLKDLGAYSAGDAFHVGMRVLRDVAWTEPHDSYLAAKFRAAGFIFLGKTNTPELGLLPTTEPQAYGATHNPWDLGRSPGGSSGGSAAAVAAGMVPAAHATDGGGSIRVPASFCGLVGLKTSRGRVSLGPSVGERWAGFSVENAVTRSVRDTAAILDAIAGPMTGDPYAAPVPMRPYASEVGEDPGRLRIGLMIHAPGGMAVHSDCVTAAENAAKLLAGLKHQVERAHPEGLADPELVRSIVTIISCSTARALDAWSGKIGRTIDSEDTESLTWTLAELGRAISAPDYIRAVDYVHAQSRKITSWWERYDLLLTPTQAEPPPPLGSFAPQPHDPLAGFLRAATFSTFTSAFNATGQPALSLPLHWSGDGLPIGVQLVAAYGREDVLIRIAAQLEQECPWANRRPPIHA
jgi:amidase